MFKRRSVTDISLLVILALAPFAIVIVAVL